MLKKITNNFNKHKFLGPVDLISLVSISKIKKIRKGEYLAKSGDINYQIVSVVKGLLRHYIVDDKGVEKTMLFVSEKQNTGSMESIFYDEPAFESIVAIEDSLVIMFDNRKAEKLALKSRGLLQLQNESLKKSLFEAVCRLRLQTLLSPEERYESFRKTFPLIEQRVKQKHLASYLGITPTSLSRMRARIIK